MVKPNDPNLALARGDDRVEFGESAGNIVLHQDSAHTELAGGDHIGLEVIQECAGLWAGHPPPKSQNTASIMLTLDFGDTRSWQFSGLNQPFKLCLIENRNAQLLGLV